MNKEAHPIIKGETRKKATPLEAELDLSGKFHMEICRNRVWKVGGSHRISAENSKRREDLKMYGHLPDYGEFHGYDLGIDSELSQIAEKIYANFYKQSRRTSKRHLRLV